MVHLSKRWQIRIFFAMWMVILFVYSKQPFNFLLLNTFLGYIPIELSFHLNQRIINSSLLYWPILLLWIVFYPNAPYIMTDLLHLALLDPYAPMTGLLKVSQTIWLNYFFLVVSALTCAVIGAWSLSQAVKSLMTKLNVRSKWIYGLLVLTMTVLASIGVFIGRFLRIHSFYLFLSPRLFIDPLLQMWTPAMLTFTALMTGLQLIIYWVISINHHE